MLRKFIKEKPAEFLCYQQRDWTGFSLVHRLTAKTNTVIYKVNRRELYCAVELPLSDYKLYGKQLAAIRV